MILSSKFCRPLMALIIAFIFVIPLPGYSADVSSSDADSLEVIGRKITSLEYYGDDLPNDAKLKFSELIGLEFQPQKSRQALFSYQENGGDSLVKIYSIFEKSGIKLAIEVKSKTKVKSLLFVGNSSVQESILLGLTDFKENIDFDSDLLKAIIKKVASYYTSQGYLASDVKGEFNPVTKEMKIVIFEGEPTLIGEIEISPLTMIEDQKLRRRFESDLAEKFSLNVGDRVQRDQVLEGVQNVKDWIRDRDFLLSKDPNLEYKVMDDNRVRLFLNIQYGPRVRFGFRGNNQFSYHELMSFVGDAKETSTGSDYLATVKRKILDAYREIGFPNVQISSLVREDAAKGVRYISVIIDEGKKVSIESLNIEGVFSLSMDESKAKFYEYSTRLVQRNYFHESGINKAADLFADYLKSRGFLSAKLEFIKFDFNPERTKVNVTLLFNEGIQTIVQSLKLSGLKYLSEKEAISLLGIEEGKPFDIFSFEKGIQDIKEKYQSIGNLSAQILNEGNENIVQYSKDKSLVNLTLEIEEGPVFKVGEIFVKGNQQTHARVILRELPFISKDILTKELLNEAEANLRKLNLFSSVIVRAIDNPIEDDLKDILILIEENDAGSIELTPGFRNDLGLKLGLGAGYQNLGGWHRSINGKIEVNRRLENFHYAEHNIFIGFREPYLANRRLIFSSNLNFFKRQYPSFDATISKITNGVRWDFTKTVSGLFDYSYERNNIENARNSYSPKDDRKEFIGAMTPGIIYDSRIDRKNQEEKFNPIKGVYSINRVEYASRYFGSMADISYTKFTTATSFYIPVMEESVFALAVNFGFARSNLKDRKIPIFKLFRMGGMGSIRGYSDDTIEVETTKDINGSLALVNYRGELRIPLKGAFGTAIFLDAGNLMVDRISLSPSTLRSSVGTGFRYTTPVGPVLLDFAWRLQTVPTVGDTKVADQDRFRVHFAIGVF